MDLARGIAVFGFAFLAACSASGGAGSAGRGSSTSGASSSSGGADLDAAYSGGGDASTQRGDGGDGATDGGYDSLPAIVSGGVTEDDGPMSDPEIAYSVTLTMDTFIVNPGQEVYMCQDFANPFHGQQADIKTYDLTMEEGSHHMFAFYNPNATSGSVAACPRGGFQFGPFTFGSQNQHAVVTYPEGVGATLPPTTGFTLNVHYINPGSVPIVGHVALTMYIAKPGIITQHAGVLFLSQALIVVPPTGQPSTSSATYTLPQDIYLLSSQSHMHQRATNFLATASTGDTLFETTQWAEPAPKTYAPPLALAAGTQVTWSCTYVNDTGMALTYGESAAANVMCIALAIYYPVKDINNPVIDSEQP